MKKHITGRLQISTECNQDCIFCSVPKEDVVQPTLDEIKERIDHLKEEGTNDLFITGGEPLIHKDIFEILDYASKKGFDEITIQSNLSGLKEGMVEKIKSYGNVKFNASFHSHEKESFNKLARKDNYDIYLKNLKEICDNGIYVFLTVVINSMNYKKLKELVIFVKKNYPRITHFSFNYVDPTGRCMANPDIVPKISKAERYIAETVDYILRNGMSFRLERVPLCYMAGFEEFSTEVRLPELGEKKMTYFAQESPEKFKTVIVSKEGYVKSDCCKKCTLNHMCPGLNQRYAEIHGKNELYPVFSDPNEISKRIIESKASTGKSYLEKINQELELYKKAIELKPNKNNIYDTYSYFLMKNRGFQDAEIIYRSWKILTQRIKRGEHPDLLSIYIHFPYCVSNCDYCVYPSTELKSKEQIQDYIEYLIRDMEKYAPLFKGLKFKTLSIGGGTPSLMSPEQMDQLFSAMFSLFEFEEDGEKSIEFNPYSTDSEKLKTIDNYGFNKLSYGVQSLSKRVLEGIGRGYQNPEQIKKAINLFKDTNIGYLNVDLLLGLRGDTPEDFLYTFEEICKMGPGFIAIYPIKTNDKYIKTRYGTTEKFFEFYYPLFEKVTKGLIPIADKYDFKTSDDFDKLSLVHPFGFGNLGTRRKDVKYRYSNFKSEPYSTLGFGYYAESCIDGIMRYTCVDRHNICTMFLKKFSTDKQNYGYNALGFAPHFSKVKFITHSVYEGFKMSRNKYKDMFGSDIAEDFSYAIDALIALEKIRLDENHVYFLIKDEKEIYPYLLFFVGKDYALKDLLEGQR